MKAGRCKLGLSNPGVIDRDAQVLRITRVDPVPGLLAVDGELQPKAAEQDERCCAADLDALVGNGRTSANQSATASARAVFSSSVRSSAINTGYLLSWSRSFSRGSKVRWVGIVFLGRAGAGRRAREDASPTPRHTRRWFVWRTGCYPRPPMARLPRLGALLGLGQFTMRRPFRAFRRRGWRPKWHCRP